MEHTNAFGCDCNPQVKKLCMKNFRFARWHENVHNESFACEDTVDLFAAGFPCQPYSTEGSRRGSNDPRASTVHPIMEYLSNAQPRMCFLENVGGLLHAKHAQFFQDIMHQLSNIRGPAGNQVYMVTYKLLNSRLHGLVPQQRQRVYIVGIKLKHYKGNFRWPDISQPASLANVLQQTAGCVGASTFSRCARRNLTMALDDINQYSDAEKHDYIVDIGHGRHKPVYGTNFCPTITASRGSSRAFVHIKGTTVQHKLNVNQLAALQGSSPGRLSHDMLSDCQFGRIIGNAMTVTLVKRLLEQMMLVTRMDA